MTVLVTGANGFVGRAVMSELHRRGIAARAALRRTRRDEVAQFDDSVIVGEVDANTDWSVALSGAEYVIHLVARTHVTHESVADPLSHYRRVNVGGTIKLAREAARGSVRRFVFVSSVKAAGERTDGRPLTEDDEPSPEDPYGISKLEAEQALADELKGTGVEWVIVRPPMVYGPGVKANMLALSNAVMRGLPLPLNGVNNRRSLVGITNLADFIVHCLFHPNAINEIFFVSDGEDVSSAELVRDIGVAAGKPARLWTVPPAILRSIFRLFGKSTMIDKLTGSLQVDISRARRNLEWSPKMAMVDELRLMMADMAGPSDKAGQGTKS